MIIPHSKCGVRWTDALTGKEHACQWVANHIGEHTAGCSSFPAAGGSNCTCGGGYRSGLNDPLCERHASRARPAGLESSATLVVEPPAKAPMDRIGEVPRAMRALALQIAYGATRPGRAPGCWQRLTRAELIGKALRHLIDAASGEVLDESGRSHLVAAMTDCAFAVEMEGQA